MSQSTPWRQRFHAWLTDNPDERILRWVFWCLVVVTIAGLTGDLTTSNGAMGDASPSDPRSASTEFGLPGIPSILSPLLPGGDKRLVPLPQQKGLMANPMQFELVGSGRLLATGTITPGTADAFTAEIKKRGDYVKTVVLNSPGGSVADALAMGRLIRERKYTTEVEAGKLCASSCPLVFAGGVERRAGDKATIGVHQVAALASVNGPPHDEMDVAQRISARCERYLGDMGVNLQVWVHAMETPPDKLFVFKPAELKSLNIVTGPALATAASKP
jgi:hypothetical protein